MSVELWAGLVAICYLVACFSGFISAVCKNWIPATLGVLFIVFYPIVHVFAGGQWPPPIH